MKTCFQFHDTWAGDDYPTYFIADIAANEKSRIGGTKKVNAFRDGFLILLHMIKLFFTNEK